MGAAVSFSITLTVRRCCGGLTIATLKFDDAPSCGLSNSVAANFADQEQIPSLSGASNSTSVQYKALVSGHGASPRLACPRTAPVSSQTSMSSPARLHPAADLAPTLILNFSPITTGEGMSHTAKLVMCGLVWTKMESGFAW